MREPSARERFENYEPSPAPDPLTFDLWVRTKISSYRARCRGKSPYLAECSTVVSPRSLARQMEKTYPHIQFWIVERDGRYVLIAREKEHGRF